MLQVVDAAARLTAWLYRRSHGKTFLLLDSLFSLPFWVVFSPLLSCFPPFSAITSVRCAFIPMGGVLTRTAKATMYEKWAFGKRLECFKSS